jgi:hypothetical protein
MSVRLDAGRAVSSGPQAMRRIELALIFGETQARDAITHN